MYTSKISSDNDIQNSQYEQRLRDFFDGLDIPHLDEEEREHLEKELTLEELKDALMSFSDNKSPGEDGFTKEFYQTFFDLLCKDLLNSYIEAF